MIPLLNSNISVIKGLKIKIKGRLNGAPKAKHKSVTIGDVPTQSINSFLDYAQTAVHTKNGTYGIKVWVASKTQKSKCFYNLKKLNIKKYVRVL